MLCTSTHSVHTPSLSVTLSAQGRRDDSQRYGMDVRRGSDGGRIRKRKADGQDEIHNERLSKRLSLLNLELNGRVKCPTPLEDLSPSFPSQATTRPETENKKPRRLASATSNDAMSIDNTPHRVYIHNIDDELSDSESSADEGRFVFHPDIKRHLLETRIPQSVRVNADGDLAGINVSNELVLYDIPSSLTVPEDRDSVRKAIIESRARARDAQRREREAFRTAPANLLAMTSGPSTFEHFARPSMLLNQGVTSTQDDEDAMDID